MISLSLKPKNQNVYFLFLCKNHQSCIWSFKSFFLKEKCQFSRRSFFNQIKSPNLKFVEKIVWKIKTNLLYFNSSSRYCVIIYILRNIYLLLVNSNMLHITWDKVFKNRPSKICGRQLLNYLKSLRIFWRLSSTNFTWSTLEYFVPHAFPCTSSLKRCLWVGISSVSEYGNTLRIHPRILGIGFKFFD